MQLLREFIQCTLLEARADDLKKKYPEFNSQIDVLTSSVKPKYLNWAVTQLKLGHSTNDIVPTLNFFDKNQSKFEKKDINAYDLKSLENAVKSIGSEKSGRQQRKDAKVDGAEKIYEDDQIVLLHIKSKQASVCYGVGTKWCITMKDADYFEEYTDASNVVFYFAINKQMPPSDTLHKVAFAVRRNGNNKPLDVDTFDAEDKELNPTFESDDDYDFANYGQTLRKMKNIAVTDAAGRPATLAYRIKRTPETVTIAELDKIFSRDAKETASQDATTSLKYFCLSFMKRFKNHGQYVDKWIQQCASDQWEEFKLRAMETIAAKLSTSYLRYFADDVSSNVRFFVARNSSDTDVLKKLSKDENYKVRFNAVSGMLEIHEVGSEVDDALKEIFTVGEDNAVLNTIAKNIDIELVPEFMEIVDRRISAGNKREDDDWLLQTFNNRLEKGY